MKTLVTYQLHQYLKNSKFVMPLIVLMALLFCNYSVRPAVYIDCLLLADILVFFIMAWVGVTTCSQEPEVSEQIILLRLKGRRAYYISHMVLQLILSFFVALLSILVPVVQNVRGGNHFFLEEVTRLDIFGGFLILFATAFAGSALGEISHSRLIKERKISVSLVFLLAILSVLKGAIIQNVPAAKIILWVLLPVSDGINLFSRASHLSIWAVFGGSGILFLSGIIWSVVKVEILERKGF